MKQLLPLAHHAKTFVVQDELLDRRAELHRSAHFLHVHQPRCLAGDVDDQSIRVGNLHTDGGGQAIAHGAKASARHPTVRAFKAQELRGPHLVLAHFGGDIAVHALGQGFQALQRVLRFDRLGRIGVAQALHGAPFVKLFPPLGQTFFVDLAATGLPDPQRIFQNMGHVAHNPHIDPDHLVDRGRINIDMNLLRFRAEIGNAAGDAVVKARADVQHQIAAMHGEVGLIKPVHPQHAQPLVAAGRIGAQTHQG